MGLGVEEVGQFGLNLLAQEVPLSEISIQPGLDRARGRPRGRRRADCGAAGAELRKVRRKHPESAARLGMDE